MVMRTALLIILMAASQLVDASPDAGNALCMVKGNTFELDIGRAKVPTYAAVVLPDGNLLRLRYLPEKVDTLGAGYSNGRVTVQLKHLTGIDGKMQRRPVFKAPGTYLFIMQDANTAEGMERHRLQCSVTLTKNQIGLASVS